MVLISKDSGKMVIAIENRHDDPSPNRKRVCLHFT